VIVFIRTYRLGVSEAQIVSSWGTELKIDHLLDESNKQALGSLKSVREGTHMPMVRRRHVLSHDIVHHRGNASCCLMMTRVTVMVCVPALFHMLVT